MTSLNREVSLMCHVSQMKRHDRTGEVSRNSIHDITYAVRVILFLPL